MFAVDSNFMKRLVIFSLLGAAMLSATPVTSINLFVPNFHSPNWDVPLNQNWGFLTNMLTGVTAVPGINLTNLLITPHGTPLPATCVVGQLWFLTTATAGQNVYGCTGVNTWTQQAGGGGGSGTVTSFSAPSGSWPTWLVPSVISSTTTPTL